MGNIKNIYFDWNKAGSCQVRQYDHLSNRVIFGNAPKFENYYLLVAMKESESDEQAKEMSPIKLTSPAWLIPNSYTQMVQQIKFQICNQGADGTFEQHSAEYIINVVKSHGHEGEDIDVDPSPMYDAYKEYVDDRVEELIDEAGGISVDTREYVDEKIQTMIAAAGDVAIDSTLSVSGAAADAKATGDAISETNERLDEILPHEEQQYSAGDTSGWYKLENGQIVRKSNTSYTCDKIPVETWMKKVSGNILSTSGINADTVFCGFTDSNDSYISRTPIVVGEFEINVPDNAAYIYLSFFGSAYTGSYSISSDSLVTKSEMAIVEEDVERINDMLTEHVKHFTSGVETGYYYQSDNNIAKRTSSQFSCLKIAVKSWMAFVEFTIYSVSGINQSAVFCGFTDSNDSFISKAELAVGEAKLAIPSNAAYIYMSFFGSTYNSEFVIKNDTFVKMSEIGDIANANPFAGLKGVAFGTSLTYKAETTGGYLNYLPSLLDMEFDNQGIGSACWYASNQSLDVLYAVQNYSDYADKDICIIEGCVNDWSGSRTLGTYKDTGITTVCGCLYNMISHIYAQNPSIQIFVVLDHYGRNYSGNDVSSTALNSNNLTQYDYYEEISKLCALYGIPAIKEYALSSIGTFGEQYLMDQIHCNAFGAKQSAIFIAARMRSLGTKVIA